MSARFTRPPTPAGFDPSRAAERARTPRGWRYDDTRRQAVYDVIAERRDVRRFRPDEVPDDVLDRILGAAHRAPSVGLMQPWRLIVIRDIATRSQIRRFAQRERIRQADRFDERARAFLDQKVEGVVESPVGICVCCDHGEPEVEVLGRGTIPATDVYSTACAIENLWLAARAEGLGIGWVSFYRPADLSRLLGLPERVEPIAYLCVGWPDELPVRPTLEAVGWSSRLPLEAVVMREQWPGDRGREPAVAPGDGSEPAVAPRRESEPAGAPQGGSEPAVAPEGGPGVDRGAAIAARDRLDELVKPAGSLGALEPAIERWTLRSGAPPPERIRAGIIICAADHGHLGHGTSLFDSHVSAQVAAAAACGETAVGVLAARDGHRLVIADVGLRGDTPPGVRDLKLARGTADMTADSALTPDQFDAALRTGGELAAELAAGGVDCLVLGEIGIGNTATTAALTSALTGAPPERTVGRGTGVDAAGIERKRATVAAALARHGARLDARAALLAFGGLELAALAGVVIAAGPLGLPVILDGYATGAAALAATGIEPLAVEGLFAGHRSAEPGHQLVLAELGLEPLIDLRLRLGEASGALLALPLLEAAGSLHRRMGTFQEAGVDR